MVTVRRSVSPIAAASLLLLYAASAFAEGRIVVGTVTALDPAGRTMTVKDGLGVPWNFKADRKAGIDLGALKAGDKVRVEIGRATPANMMSAADILRKGDKVTVIKSD